MGPSSSTHRQGESGIVILAVFVVLIFGVVAAAFFFVKHSQDKKSVSTTAAEAVSAGGSAITRNAENVQRKNDAALLLAATTSYAAENGGQLPTSLSSDMLKGMGHYTAASIVSGDQEPLTTDELRLVTKAACTSGGQAVAATSSRAFIAQYTLENADGSFTAQCQAQ